MYTVNIWGSKPGTNDDCWTGGDFADLAAARAAYADPSSMSTYIRNTIAGATGEVWVEIDGPDVHMERRLRKANARAQARERAADRLELATEAGMGLGVVAYNEAMGWE